MSNQNQCFPYLYLLRKCLVSYPTPTNQLFFTHQFRFYFCDGDIRILRSVKNLDGLVININNRVIFTTLMIASLVSNIVLFVPKLHIFVEIVFSFILLNILVILVDKPLRKVTELVCPFQYFYLFFF